MDPSRLCYELNELIANMSANADSFQWIGYNETVSYVESAAVYEYHIRCTISMCESVEGQTRRALEALIQNETYDEVLSHCLGRVLSGVSSSFASTRSALPTLDTVLISSTLMESTDGPTACPTPRSTWVFKNGEKHCDEYCVI